MLTASEESVLARGGVEPVSGEDVAVVQARAASAYEELREGSLTVDEAAARTGSTRAVSVSAWASDPLWREGREHVAPAGFPVPSDRDWCRA